MEYGTRLSAVFDRCGAENRAALSVFISAGDPDLATSFDILCGLPGSGADIVELGMPFTDPIGDGVSVQKAGQRALKAGIKLANIFDMVAKFRRQDDKTPIVLMGYYNTIYSCGVETFLGRCAAAGVDALIVVDLPPEEDGEMWDLAVDRGVIPIRFVAPATTVERFPKVLRNAHGFLYFVAIEGVTGAGLADESTIEGRIAELKKHSPIPIAIGFGIKTRSDVARMARLGDAVIVGSVIVDAIMASLDTDGRATERTVPSVLHVVEDLRGGLLR
jgi:tryptophan synthase alpha chain